MLWRTIPGAAVLLVVVTVGHAQNSPHIGYVYPAGGQQGATVQVKIGGQYLDGVAGAYISGPGVRAAVAELTKPLTQKQVNELREKLQELMKKGKDAAVVAEIMEVRKKLATFNRNANPAIAETVTVEVTIDPNAQAGVRELRLSTPLGVSNPTVFCVGRLPEVCEKESSTGNQPGVDGPPRFLRPAQSSAEESEMAVTLPAMINGRIMPGDVDRYRFQARKGQSLVVAASARALIPYMADAVPGWFQATLTLYDAQGKEVAYADDFRFDPDPVLHYEVPADGEYVIEIKDAIYRGREDFVYRLAAGELPFVTSVFPLGGPAGTRTSVEMRGWNLPADAPTPDTVNYGPGIHPISVGNGAQASNLVPFVVDTLPECLEKESNNEQPSAQTITLPQIVNGRIDPPGDTDVFCFEGRAGGEIVAEVYARRLSSPLDSAIRLTDASSRQLAANDDQGDKGDGLATHHADSLLRVTLPADGTYYLHLGDAQGKGGEEYGYRLRISPPRRDFELRIVPSGVNVRGGTVIPLTVYALRKDGFTDTIDLALKDAPEGFALGGGWMPAGQDQIRITLTVPPTPTQEPLSLALEGRATIQGREVVHPVVPAEDMMQAFFYRHLVPVEELKVAISGRWMGKGQVRILSDTPARIPAGGTTRVRVAARAIALTGKVELELSEPPEGIAIQKVEPSREGAEIVLQADAAKAKPGLKGNLIIQVFAVNPPVAAQKSTPVNRPRVPANTLPAIPFEITGPE